MALGKKILFIIAVVFITIAGVLYVIADRMVLESFRRLERHNSEKNVMRAVNAITSELDNLNAVGGDWGPWNDTRDFLLQPNDDYIKNNLSQETLENLRVDFMVFVGGNGRIVYIRGIDPAAGTDDAKPVSLTSLLADHPALLVHRNPKDSKKGLLRLPEGPALITSWPITDSNFQKPIRGSLILGRFLSQSEINRLMEKTALSIRLVCVLEGNLPADFETIQTQLSESVPIVVREMTQGTISGYTSIHDIDGNPCILLRVDTPREIFAYGKESVRYFTIATVFAGALILLILYILLQRIVIHPIAQLKQHILSIKETGNLSTMHLPRRRDEIGILAYELNQMVVQLKEKREELSESNSNLQIDIAKRNQVEEELRAMNQILQQSLSELKETQNQLVQSEKMASLGGLVAGVAHEINTPLGVALTASSFLQDRTRELTDGRKTNPPVASDIRKYMTLATEASNLIVNNLERVAELVNSFKQVSVNQSGDQHKWFLAKKYLDQLLVTLRPNFLQSNHSVTVECPEKLEIDSYPGIFAQIITNLVMNSLIHGFQNRETGKIEIQIRPEKGGLLLRYRDDGNGMDKETLDKMFEPFFTTKRGQGGTGLGMHILYNLITQSLHGKVECTSAPREGVLFLIRIPLDSQKIRYR